MGQRKITARELVAKIKDGGPLTRRDLRAIEAFNRSAYARAVLAKAGDADREGEGSA